MQLDLKDIIREPGSMRLFSFELDLSQLNFFGENPITMPVFVSGKVRNMAGALVLEAEAITTLHHICSRCLVPFEKELVVSFETLMATELADEASEDTILLLKGTTVDLDEVMTESIVLAMETKNLCSEDCKGICAGCGADLNVEPCRCKPALDPRLASLSQLLEESTNH